MRSHRTASVPVGTQALSDSGTVLAPRPAFAHRPHAPPASSALAAPFSASPALAGWCTYLLVSLYLPSSRWLIFGVDKRTGDVRRGAAARHLPAAAPVLPADVRAAGRVRAARRIRSASCRRRSVPVTLNYRLRFGIAGDRLPDAQRMVDEGLERLDPRARRRGRVARSRSRSRSRSCSRRPRSSTRERDPLRRTVATHLARSGLKVTAFEIARIEADRDALLRVKRAELRRDARGVAGRAWPSSPSTAPTGSCSPSSPTTAASRTSRALATGGTTASLQTIQPTVSPMVWTTVATGLTPDRHGVIDFIDRGATHAGRRVLAPRAGALGYRRRLRTQRRGRSNWWTAWPPTPPDSSSSTCRSRLQPNAVYPPTLAQRAAQLDVPAGHDRLRAGAALPQHLAGRMRAGDRPDDPTDPVNVFRARPGQDLDRSSRRHQSLQRRAAARPRSDADHDVVRRHRRRQSSLRAVSSAATAKASARRATASTGRPWRTTTPRSTG